MLELRRGGEEKSYEKVEGVLISGLLFFYFVFIKDNQEGRSTPAIPTKG